MVIKETAGGADPLGGGTDQQVQDGLFGHGDRGQLFLLDILIAYHGVAEVIIQLADED